MSLLGQQAAITRVSVHPKPDRRETTGAHKQYAIYMQYLITHLQPAPLAVSDLELCEAS